MAANALAYVEGKGWKYREESGQLRCKVCPACGDVKWHFYINEEDGRARCWKCQWKGNLYKLKKLVGDSRISTARESMKSGKRQSFSRPKKEYIEKCHRRLLAKKKILSYVRERGFSMKTIRHFKLGCERKRLSKDHDPCWWLLIPYFRGDDPINIKYRSIPPAPKMFRRWKGAESALFNENDLKNEGNVHFTEAETDAMILWQKGFRPVIASSVGADNFDPGWFDILEPVDRFNMIYDSDIAGQRGSFLAAQRVGLDRCWNVLLPEDAKDANQFFSDGGKKLVLRKLIKEARLFDVSEVMTAGAVLSRVRDDIFFDGNEPEVTTPWERVNRILKMEPGDLVVLSAQPKIGKTTLALDVAKFNAWSYIPVLFFCLEMRPERLGKKLACNLREVDDDNLDETDVLIARHMAADKPLYFANDFRPTPETAMQLIRDAVRRYGVKLVVFDNLHFLLRSASNQREQIEVLSKDFKLLAEELSVPILLIVHPRKVQGQRVIDFNDLRGSAAIPADADTIAIMHRKKAAQTGGSDDPLSSETLFRVDASRYGPGGDAWLHYHGAQSRFEELQGKRKRLPSERQTRMTKRQQRPRD